MATTLSGPIPIQLALQGGGAKIYGLCAAMEALQEFEEANAPRQFRVTRIAGTSAGAIVGSFFAAGIPFRALRAQARTADKTRLKKVFPRRGLLDATTRGLLNSPFWDEGKVATIIQKILDAHLKKRPKTIAELCAVRDIPVAIVRTDLINGNGDRVPETDNLIGAILDSCGIPFFFRTGTGQGRFVDGGISDNFPAMFLDRNDLDAGSIIGVGFEQKTRLAPAGPFQLAASLLDVAMNSSMSRARARVGPDFVHDIKSDYDTFDFNRLIDEGFDQDYDLALHEARNFFSGLHDRLTAARTKPRKLIRGDPWTDGDKEGLQKMGDLYKAHHHGTKFSYLESHLEIYANSLFPEDHPFFGPAIFAYRLLFRLAKDTIYCHSVAIAPSPNGTTTPGVEGGGLSLNSRLWSLLDAKGHEINTLDFPAIDRDNPDDRRMVLYFNPPLSPSGGFTEPFTFTFRDNTNGVLNRLKLDGHDYVGSIFEHAQGSVQTARIILHVPIELKSLRMEQASLPDKLIVAGRRMGPLELSTATSPGGYRTIGWMADNISPDHMLLARVLL